MSRRDCAAAGWVTAVVAVRPKGLSPTSTTGKIKDMMVNRAV